jgi:ABC-type Fe3+ transport system permease subunit
LARLLTRSASAPYLPANPPLKAARTHILAGRQARVLRQSSLTRVEGVLYSMAALLIILFVTVGLAIRAGAYSRQWSAADSESAPETGFIDTCARTFILVLLSLLGLLALGLMYGNVLGAANASS